MEKIFRVLAGLALLIGYPVICVYYAYRGFVEGDVLVIIPTLIALGFGIWLIWQVIKETMNKKKGNR